MATSVDDTTTETPTRGPARWKTSALAALPWRKALAVASTVTTLLMVVQAALAGQFLDGNFQALFLHQGVASLLGVALAALIVCAVAARAFRVVGSEYAVAAVALLAGSAAQAALGLTRIVWAHVPLGALLLFTSGLMSVNAWKRNERTA